MSSCSPTAIPTAMRRSASISPARWPLKAWRSAPWASARNGMTSSSMSFRPSPAARQPTSPRPMPSSSSSTSAYAACRTSLPSVCRSSPPSTPTSASNLPSAFRPIHSPSADRPAHLAAAAGRGASSAARRPAHGRPLRVSGGYPHQSQSAHAAGRRSAAQLHRKRSAG